ncbi:MAG: hypothetical protein ACJ77K_08750 [Bacteroidia bacterium]
MQKQLRILGICSLILGAAAVLLCVLPYGVFYSIPVGFLGMVCSTIYVYLDTKYSVNNRRFTAGLAGMILSSIPILLVLYFIIMGGKN